MTKRPILHPTDFSATSRRAFGKALELARASGSDLLVLHVLNPTAPIPETMKVLPPTWAEYRRVLRAWASKKLAKAVAGAKAARVHAIPLVVEGGEAREIARLARTRHASMIVMGTHRRAGLAKLVLGSVAARVLPLAPCPVLTVPGRRA
jgi:nucleotide-binding universal stress UspA family protein